MIKLRHLRLRSFTASRAFGADIPFSAGLNIVQAPNTSGKSTCLQAIIYTLGLERSLGPQLSIPLPYAMRERIYEFKDAPYEFVLQSYVELELENLAGEVLVLHRDVVGGRNTKLIQTWKGPSLSAELPRREQRDYFVLDPGAATNESGFHTYLADSLAGTCRSLHVTTAQNARSISKRFFQCCSWSRSGDGRQSKARFRRIFASRTWVDRLMEFLLDLDAARNRRRRSELRGIIAELVGKWSDARKSLDESASRVGRLRGLAAQPTAEFVAAPIVDLQLYYQGDWMRLSDVLNSFLLESLSLRGNSLRLSSLPRLPSRLAWRRLGARLMLCPLSWRRSGRNMPRKLRTTRRSRNELARSKRISSEIRTHRSSQRLGSDLGRAASERVFALLVTKACPTS